MELSNRLSSEAPLLSVDGLTVQYKMGKRVIAALNKVTLDVESSEVVAIVGESGCGKSTLGLSIIGLLQKPPAKIVSGRIIFQGPDLLSQRK